MAEEYRRRGAQSIKSPSIAIIQKDFPREHIVGVKMNEQMTQQDKKY